MNNKQKFQEIKKELDKNLDSISWKRKKYLLKELYKISNFYYFLYYFFITISFFMIIGFIFFILSYEEFTHFISNESIRLFSTLLFSIFILYLFIFLFKKSKDNSFILESKIIKNRLLDNLNKEEDNFYNKLDNNYEAFSQYLYINLVRSHFLPADMSYFFREDLKNFIKRYRFGEDLESVKKYNDESHAATRYANLKNSNSS